MTPLAALLLRRIAATGPITVADYMAECQLHPEHGYYATRDPLGRAGDFTTAPEISQMFGEVVGLALAQAWLDRGAPAPFALVELGPGRGTLMADILRATRKVPGFHAAARVHLVEASPVLRAAQARALAGITPTWLDHADGLPEAPIFLVANEFFDALPIRQFRRAPTGWHERQVGVADGRLQFGYAAAAPQPMIESRLSDTGDGDIVETCAPASAIMAAIARRIARHGGAALIVDYGGWTSLGDTLQAVQAHAYSDPLAAPGQADLTAHVDFQALAQAAASAGATHTPMVPQGVFLETLGLAARAEALAARMDPPQRAAHLAAYRRLTHPEEMGSLFQCIAVTPPSHPAFPGLMP